jgi:hypothetical protein
MDQDKAFKLSATWTKLHVALIRNGQHARPLHRSKTDHRSSGVGQNPNLPHRNIDGLFTSISGRPRQALDLDQVRDVSGLVGPSWHQLATRKPAPPSSCPSFHPKIWGEFYEDRPDPRWFWSITVYVDPKQGIITSGRAASLDEAKAQFLSNWQRCRADSTPSTQRST